MTGFDDTVVAAVTAHMNGDHPEDNLLIVRAFGAPEATGAEMTGLTGQAGVWRITDANGERELEIAWPEAPLTERPQIRAAVVQLYRGACEKLGVEPREEHEAAQSGSRPGAGYHGAGHGSDHPHGAGHPRGEAAPLADDAPFSQVIRRSTWGDHSDSEGATFMEDIMRGRGTRQDYIDLVAQHYFMYEALEGAVERVAADPAFAGFHADALVRLPALEADLAHLLGDDWREQISPVPATAEYAARMREAGEQGWVGGVVAHHYTRYLGDLSGGQMIAKRVAKQHALEREGIAFYDFTELGDLVEFKNRYRAELDRLGGGLDAAERQRVLDEVRAAYRFNTQVFIDLGRAREAAAV